MQVAPVIYRFNILRRFVLYGRDCFDCFLIFNSGSMRYAVATDYLNNLVSLYKEILAVSGYKIVRSQGNVAGSFIEENYPLR